MAGPGPAGAEGEHEAVQDLISDLRVYRARGGQDLRHPGHRGEGAGLQDGPQRGHPVSGVAVDRTARDVQRGRGLGLRQARVILQRQHLALPDGQVVQRSRDVGPPQDDRPALGAWQVSRHRCAVPRGRRGTAQLRLGHDPQVGFRAFAVHPLSVPQP
jgi:hypothetical protein